MSGGEESNLNRLRTDPATDNRWRTEVASALSSKTAYWIADFTPRNGNRLSVTTYPISRIVTDKKTSTEVTAINASSGNARNDKPRPLFTVFVTTDDNPSTYSNGQPSWENVRVQPAHQFFIGSDPFGTGAASGCAEEQLAQIVERFPKGSIDRLIINGHGAGGCGVRSGAGTIGENISPAIAKRIALRMGLGSRVDMDGCDTAKDAAAIQLLANKLQTRVRGWNVAVGWYADPRGTQLGEPFAHLPDFWWLVGPFTHSTIANPVKIDDDVNKARREYRDWPQGVIVEDLSTWQYPDRWEHGE